MSTTAQPQKTYHDQMAEAAFEYDRRRPPAPHARWGAFFHADAGAESGFTARQLEFLRPGIIAESFPDLIWSTLIPTDTSVSNGAAQYTATYSTQAGRPLVTKDMVGIVPRSDLYVDQATLNFYDIMLAYGYTFQEARTAMYAGLPLPAQKAINCREQMERELDDIMFVGNTSVGIQGLLTLTGASTYAEPTTGVGGSALWKNKNPDDVILALNGPSTAMVSSTLGVEVPDTMLLPISARDDIATRRVGDGTSVTILTYFLGNNPYIKGDASIPTTYKSETLGSGGTRLGMVYKKAPNKLQAIVSQGFEQFAPQTMGTEVVTTCHIRTAGVMLHRQGSVSYFHGF